MTSTETPSIPAFYEGRSVFITGATGFIGKVLVEKLLRSCPGIQTVYILMREKRGKEPKQRLEELLNCKVFDLVKKENPEAVHKVAIVHGDLSLPQLGVSPADLETMSKTVSVVFHSAATVKFDEPLKVAVDMNVLATRRMLELCHKLPNIVALVHVSTAYANCNLSEVDEVVYPPPFPPKQIIDATDCRIIQTTAELVLARFQCNRKENLALYIALNVLAPSSSDSKINLITVLGRGGLVVRSRLRGRRVPSSKPDSTEETTV
ncbi:Putative fatty acyl-CoA reductase CG5065 [Araneus ventricosus]|uniref:Fatty acyl-CoA reductase n=1 Tax=Araneus ventricosus TaxID=182803 RepID=A0A4Y2L2Q3_ARAVE|nr:Putative fatty acyl-CoA reductase CG5065 [Araneus ventricosus]